MARTSGGGSYRLGIFGSTHFNDKQLIYDELDKFVHANGIPTVVNSTGHHQGIELIVSKWCQRRGYKLVSYSTRLLEENQQSPDFNLYTERNKDIIAASDIILGFCIYNKSIKTLNTLRDAKTWSGIKKRKVYTYLKSETNISRQTPSPFKPRIRSVLDTSSGGSGSDNKLSPLKKSNRYHLKNPINKKPIFSSTRLSFAPTTTRNSNSRLTFI